MRQAKLVWTTWQALLQQFAWAFTRPGHRRFVEWVTALALNVEEHTITQSVVAIERTADWKALESFAEYGAWRADYVTSTLTRLLEKAPGRTWHGYRVSAVGDTQGPPHSEGVWGTCTFHEYTARCPNRAATVRAHNWVVLGALLQNPDQPAWFLPISGRLYFRKSQLPELPGHTGRTETFRTKCELAVEVLREQARITGGKHLAVFDGGFALRSVIRPLVEPEGASPRIEFLTRLRHDARLYALPPTVRRLGQRGPMPKWGKKLAPPRQGGRWTRSWQKGEAFLYGRRREVPWKEVVCLWRGSGGQGPGKAGGGQGGGGKKRVPPVRPAGGPAGVEVGGGVCARVRPG